MSKSTFGDLLRRLRTEAGLTQEELAGQARLSTRAISDLERGVNRYPYRNTVQSLAEALGVEAEVAERLSLAARRPGRTVSDIGAPRMEVPLPPNTILGRDRELERILYLLRWQGLRLVTLTGPGGVGKTRLAEEAGRALAADFTGGAAFVDLSTIAEASLVPTRIANTLQLRPPESATSEDVLLSSLRDSELLLILDNFEHVLAAGTLVSKLLANCSKLKIIATSREPLRLRGEHEIDIMPLAVPEPGETLKLEEFERLPSVALLLERARSLRPEFALTEKDVVSVGEICCRLDGLPLALELAAAHFRYGSSESVVEQVRHGLKALERGPRDVPARQQTMSAAIEWSYNLLDPEEQATFRCLGVFAGSGSAQAVSAVAGVDEEPALRLLTSLAEMSLIRLAASDRTDLRFRMLETVHAYAAERLAASGEFTEAGAAHARYYLELAEAAYPELTGQAAEEWMSRLVDETDNFRAARRRHDASGDTASGLRLAGALWRPWLRLGLVRELRQWVDTLLDRPDSDTPSWARGRAAYAGGLMAYLQHECEAAEIRLEEAETLIRDLTDANALADLLSARGLVAAELNEYQRAEAYLSESLALSRRLGDPFATGRALENLGVVAQLHGDLGRAAELYKESVDAYSPVGQSVGATVSTSANLRHLLCLQGQYDQARRQHLDTLRSSGERDGWTVADTLGGLGDVAMALGDLEEAEIRYRESLSHFEAIRATGAIALGLARLANVQRAWGRYDQARDAANRSLEIEPQNRGNARTAAFAHLCLGDIALGIGDAEQAHRQYRESLEISVRIENLVGVVDALTRVAWLLASAADPNGISCLAAATALRRRVGMDLPPVERPAQEAALAALSEGVGATAFEEIWASGEAMGWSDAATSALLDPGSPLKR